MYEVEASTRAWAITSGLVSESRAVPTLGFVEPVEGAFELNDAAGATIGAVAAALEAIEDSEENETAAERADDVGGAV